MNETRYLISEASKVTQVDAHVLRYWEDELGLAINRNEMGHRYYTEKDIQVFQNIKELKKQGLQLKAIRRMLHQAEPDSIQRTLVEPEIEAKEKRRKDIRDIKDIKEIKEKTAEKEDLSKEKRFEEILARLIRDVELSEHKEGRYRRLDETIRRHQMSRKMVAATEENSGRKGRKKRIKRKQSE